MISLKSAVFQYGVFVVVLVVILNCLIKESGCSSLDSLDNRAALLLTDDVNRNKGDFEDFHVINTYSNMPGGGGLLGQVDRSPKRSEMMPRLDNRNHFNNVFLPRPKPRCNRKIRILNGVTRFRDKGSFVRFECSLGYTLLGANVAVCLRDQWSEAPPICVKPGCRRIQHPVNGVAMVKYGGAAVAFFCKNSLDYRLEGSVVLYCDGHRWNGTEPLCNAINSPTTSDPSTEPMEPEPTSTEQIQFSLTSSNILSTGLSSTKKSTTFTQEKPWDDNVEAIKSETDKSTFESEMSTTPLTEGVFQTTSSNPNPTSNFINHQEVITPTTTPDSIIIMPRIPNLTNASSQKPKTVYTLEPSDLTTAASSTYSTVIPTSFKLELTTRRPFTEPAFETPAMTKIVSYTTSPSITTTPIPITEKTTPTTPRRNATTRKSNKKFKKTTTRSNRLIKITTTTTPATTTKSNNITSTPTITTIMVTDLAVGGITGAKTAENFEPFPDHTFDKFDEVLGNTYDSRIPEFIRPLDPISPHKLNNNEGTDYEYYQKVAHLSIIGGIVLAVVGSMSLMGGIVMYCWRKNKGIARARPYDVDGRTLSAASDAYDDFMWLENRDSRL